MDLEESHSSNPELVEDSPEEKEPGVSSVPEPRRRSVSGSYGPVSSSSGYHCNLCQITVNSQSQLAQVSLRGPRWPAGLTSSIAAHGLQQTQEAEPGHSDQQGPCRQQGQPRWQDRLQLQGDSNAEHVLTASTPAPLLSSYQGETIVISAPTKHQTMPQTGLVHLEIANISGQYL